MCGPHLQFVSGDEKLDGDEATLAATVAALRAGKIVAVKGVGGYHLLCDATNDEAVATLRARKPRPTKPLAVMLRDLDALRAVVHTTPELDNFLASPERPIVLLPKRADSKLSEHIAPGLAEIGCLLPYSPLHDLLLNDFGGPLVATSGNLSGEPVLTDNAEAQTRLEPSRRRLPAPQPSHRAPGRRPGVSRDRRSPPAAAPGARPCAAGT